MIQLVYENNRGEKINLSELPYWVNVEPIFDYEWEYTKRQKRRGDIIAGFTKTISTKDLVLHIMAHSKSVRDNAIDKFNNVIEADIYDGTAGKIWVGDWYTYGYIVASKNEKWQYDVPVIKKTITLAREQDSWYRRTIRKSYEGEQYTPQPEEWTKNFEPTYNYQYDYMTDFDTSVVLTNPDVLPSNFVLNIQGYADRPEIHIGENVIQFNLEVEEGEALVVDAVQKKVTIFRPDGVTINAFGARNPDHYIFERIPSGRNAVTWNGAFTWEILLLEERSEPRWLTG